MEEESNAGAGAAHASSTTSAAGASAGGASAGGISAGGASAGGASAGVGGGGVPCWHAEEPQQQGPKWVTPEKALQGGCLLHM